MGVSEWTGFACVLMRMTGFILFNPILGRRNFPAMFRAGLILVLAVITQSYSPVSVSGETTVIGFVLLLLPELFIGFVVGFIINLFSYAITFAGGFVDLQMGLSMSNIYDPQSNVSMSVSATYFNLIFLLLFFAINGHLTLIRLMLSSAEAVPYGQAAIATGATDAVLSVFLLCTELAIKLALPLVAVQFLLEIGVGILMKAIPQINVFIVNLQAKILVGLAVLVVVFSPLASFIDQTLVTMFDTIYNVIMVL